MHTRIVALLAGAIFGSCTIVAQSGADETRLYYSSPAQTGGMFVALVVTLLRGASLERELPSQLKQLCPKNPKLANYKILVYPDDRTAELAKNRIGEIPNLNDPQWHQLESALLANYQPSDGVLTIKSDVSDGKRETKLGTAWCRKGP